MKYALLFIILYFTSTSFSQDIIYKHDSGSINGKVVTVVNGQIKYTGPGLLSDTLKIATSLVERIEYSNGDVEYFSKPEIVVPEEEEKNRHDEWASDGYFGQILFGVANYHGYNNNNADPGFTHAFDDHTTKNLFYAGVTIKAGVNYYFEARNKNSFGFHLTYGRVSLFWDINSDFIGNSLSPVLPGFIHSIKLSKHTTFNYNAFAGFNITNIIPFGNYELETGFIYGAECNFAFKELFIGLEIARSHTHFREIHKTNVNMINIGIGYNLTY